MFVCFFSLSFSALKLLLDVGCNCPLGAQLVHAWQVAHVSDRGHAHLAECHSLDKLKGNKNKKNNLYC